MLAVLYANIEAKLNPDSITPISNKITKANLQHAMNLVKYYMDQKAILVKVTWMTIVLEVFSHVTP